MTRKTLLDPLAGRRPAVLALLSTLCLWASFGATAAEDLDRVVLRVNDEIATLHEYEARKSAEMTRILSNPQMTADQRQASMETVGQEVMQGMFSELLLLSFADQQGIKIRDAEVDEAVETLKQQQGMTSRVELDEALAAFGMTYDDLWENTRRDLLWNQVVGREVNSQIDIGDEELRAYYRNNRDQFQLPERRQLREIIVLDSTGVEGEALVARANELQQRLVAGESLDGLAEETKDAGWTTGVIDLDWLERGELEEGLEQAAWALQVGSFSPPIAGRGGYHILELVALEEAGLRPFKEVEEAISRRERSRRFAKELRDFIKEIEHKSYIVENLPPEAVGYRNLVEDFETEDGLEAFRSQVIPGGKQNEASPEASPEASSESASEADAAEDATPIDEG